MNTGSVHILPRNTTLLLIIAAGIIARIIFWSLTQYTSDDAFITYRYVQNIIAGKGFVFNPGEYVLGTTTPLYTLLLTLFGSILGSEHVPAISLVISIACDVGILIALGHLLTGQGPLVQLIPAILYGFYPKVILIGISGMEASMAVLFMLLALVTYLRGDYILTGLSMALHLLARPDAAIWTLILLGLILIQKHRIPFRIIKVSLLPIIGWLIFSQWYFHTILPHSLVAKNIAWSHLFPTFDPLRIVTGYFPTFISRHPSEIWPSLLIGMMVLILIAAIVECLKDRSPLIIVPVFFIIYNLVFSFGKVHMTDWYYLPGYVSFFITIALALRRLPLTMVTSSKFLRYIPAIILLVLLPLNVMAVVRWDENLAGLFRRQNKALGSWLNHNTDPDRRIIAEPIGYLGYYSGRYVYDYIGLVSPQVVEYRRKYMRDQWFINFLREHQPDYIVLRNWEIPFNRLFHGYGDGFFHDSEEQTWFLSTYREIEWSPEAARDSVHLVLYGLRSLDFASFSPGMQ